MNDIRDLKELIVFSLDAKPANFEELIKRDFLHNRSSYGIGILLKDLEIKNKIYIRGDKMYAYKKAVKEYAS